MNIDSFYIPGLSDEGVTKTISLYKNLYKEGKIATQGTASSRYLHNIINLSTDRKPTENDLDFENNKRKIYPYQISIMFAFLDAMKEDIEEYGIDEYIKRINNQILIPNLFTYEKVYKAIKFPRDIIIKRVSQGKIDSFPDIIKYLYDQSRIIGVNNTYSNRVLFIDRNFDGDIKERMSTTGKKMFRLYLNTPIGKSGIEFFHILSNALIKKRIPFGYKYNENPKYKDKTIMYFPADYIKDVVSILDSIGEKYPEIISKFGTPPFFTAQKSYYGISHGGRRAQTFSSYATQISVFSFFCCFCRKLKMHETFGKLTAEEKKIVLKYAQDAMDESLFQLFRLENSISFPKSPLDEASMIYDIVKKYGNSFDYDISIDEYRTTFQRIASASEYGDLDTSKNIPFAFSYSMIEAMELDKNNIKTN